MQLSMIDDRGLAVAHRAADIGMDLVLQHAEEICDQWGKTAYLWLVTFSREHPRFIGHDVVQASVGQIEQPHDTRAWGRIFKRGQKVGFIRFHQFVPAPHRHAAPCPQYVSLICGDCA